MRPQSTDSSPDSLRHVRDFDVDIGRIRAGQLLKSIGVEALPKPGHELKVASAKLAWPHDDAQLWLANEGGQLKLTSFTTKVLAWAQVFGPAFDEFSATAAEKRAAAERADFMATLDHFFACDGDSPGPAELLKLVPTLPPEASGRDHDAISNLVMAYGHEHGLTRYFNGVAVPTPS